MLSGTHITFVFPRWLSVGVMLCVALLSGCMSVPSARPPFRVPDNVPVPMGSGLPSLNDVTNRASICSAIKAFEMALENDPTNYRKLTTLGNLHILRGAAYETRVSVKREAYAQALFYNQVAMMTSPAFAARIEEGKPVWDAADVLGKEHVEAVGFWVTALFYQFDECLPKPLKPFNLRWIRRAEKMLQTAAGLDLDWGGGQIHLSYGFYYMMPKAVGGDMRKSEASFDKAVVSGPGWLINRWARARYLYPLTGNRKGYVSDLEWVLNEDPLKADGPVFWNIYCRRDARRCLQQVDQHFRATAR